jgi:hypothetical protein
LWTVVLVAMFSGNKLISDYVFARSWSVLACVGLMEFYGLVEKRGLVCFSTKVWPSRRDQDHAPAA